MEEKTPRASERRGHAAGSCGFSQQSMYIVRLQPEYCRFVNVEYSTSSNAGLTQNQMRADPSFNQADGLSNTRQVRPVNCVQSGGAVQDSDDFEPGYSLFAYRRKSDTEQKETACQEKGQMFSEQRSLYKNESQESLPSAVSGSFSWITSSDSGIEENQSTETQRANWNLLETLPGATNCANKNSQDSHATDLRELQLPQHNAMTDSVKYFCPTGQQSKNPMYKSYALVGSQQDSGYLEEVTQATQNVREDNLEVPSSDIQRVLGTDNHIDIESYETLPSGKISLTCCTGTPGYVGDGSYQEGSQPEAQSCIKPSVTPQLVKVLSRTTPLRYSTEDIPARGEWSAFVRESAEKGATDFLHSEIDCQGLESFVDSAYSSQQDGNFDQGNCSGERAASVEGTEVAMKENIVYPFPLGEPSCQQRVKPRGKDVAQSIGRHFYFIAQQGRKNEETLEARKPQKEDAQLSTAKRRRETSKDQFPRKHSYTKRNDKKFYFMAQQDNASKETEDSPELTDNQTKVGFGVSGSYKATRDSRRQGPNTSQRLGRPFYIVAQQGDKTEAIDETVTVSMTGKTLPKAVKISEKECDPKGSTSSPLGISRMDQGGNVGQVSTDVDLCAESSRETSSRDKPSESPERREVIEYALPKEFNVSQGERVLQQHNGDEDDLGPQRDSDHTECSQETSSRDKPSESPERREVIEYALPKKRNVSQGERLLQQRDGDEDDVGLQRDSDYAESSQETSSRDKASKIPMELPAIERERVFQLASQQRRKDDSELQRDSDHAESSHNSSLYYKANEISMELDAVDGEIVLQLALQQPDGNDSDLEPQRDNDAQVFTPFEHSVVEAKECDVTLRDGKLFNPMPQQWGDKEPSVEPVNSCSNEKHLLDVKETKTDTPGRCELDEFSLYETQDTEKEDRIRLDLLSREVVKIEEELVAQESSLRDKNLLRDSHEEEDEKESPKGCEPNSFSPGETQNTVQREEIILGDVLQEGDNMEYGLVPLQKTFCDDSSLRNENLIAEEEPESVTEGEVDAQHDGSLHDKNLTEAPQKQITTIMSLPEQCDVMKEDDDFVSRQDCCLRDSLTEEKMASTSAYSVPEQCDFNKQDVDMVSQQDDSLCDSLTVAPAGGSSVLEQRDFMKVELDLTSQQDGSLRDKHLTDGSEGKTASTTEYSLPKERDLTKGDVHLVSQQAGSLRDKSLIEAPEAKIATSGGWPLRDQHEYVKEDVSHVSQQYDCLLDKGRTVSREGKNALTTEDSPLAQCAFVVMKDVDLVSQPDKCLCDTTSTDVLEDGCVPFPEPVPVEICKNVCDGEYIPCPQTDEERSPVQESFVETSTLLATVEEARMRDNDIDYQVDVIGCSHMPPKSQLFGDSECRIVDSTYADLGCSLAEASESYTSPTNLPFREVECQVVDFTTQLNGSWTETNECQITPADLTYRDVKHLGNDLPSDPCISVTNSNDMECQVDDLSAELSSSVTETNECQTTPPNLQLHDMECQVDDLPTELSSSVTKTNECQTMPANVPDLNVECQVNDLSAELSSSVTQTNECQTTPANLPHRNVECQVDDLSAELSSYVTETNECQTTPANLPHRNVECQADDLSAELSSSVTETNECQTTPANLPHHDMECQADDLSAELSSSVTETNECQTTPANLPHRNVECQADDLSAELSSSVTETNECQTTPANLPHRNVECQVDDLSAELSSSVTETNECQTTPANLPHRNVECQADDLSAELSSSVTETNECQTMPATLPHRNVECQADDLSAELSSSVTETNECQTMPATLPHRNVECQADDLSAELSSSVTETNECQTTPANLPHRNVECQVDDLSAELSSSVTETNECQTMPANLPHRNVECQVDDLSAELSSSVTETNECQTMPANLPHRNVECQVDDLSAELSSSVTETNECQTMPANLPHRDMECQVDDLSAELSSSVTETNECQTTPANLPHRDMECQVDDLSAELSSYVTETNECQTTPANLPHRDMECQVDDLSAELSSYVTETNECQTTPANLPHRDMECQVDDLSAELSSSVTITNECQTTPANLPHRDMECQVDDLSAELSSSVTETNECQTTPANLPHRDMECQVDDLSAELSSSVTETNECQTTPANLPHRNVECQVDDLSAELSSSVTETNECQTTPANLPHRDMECQVDDFSEELSSSVTETNECQTTPANVPHRDTECQVDDFSEELSSSVTETNECQTTPANVPHRDTECQVDDFSEELSSSVTETNECQTTPANLSHRDMECQVDDLSAELSSSVTITNELQFTRSDQVAGNDIGFHVPNILLETKSSQTATIENSNGDLGCTDFACQVEDLSQRNMSKSTDLESLCKVENEDFGCQVGDSLTELRKSELDTANGSAPLLCGDTGCDVECQTDDAETSVMIDQSGPRNMSVGTARDQSSGSMDERITSCTDSTYRSDSSIPEATSTEVFEVFSAPCSPNHRLSPLGQSPGFESSLSGEMWHGTSARTKIVSNQQEGKHEYRNQGCQVILCGCLSTSEDPQAGATLRVTEVMKREQESLVKQLDMLRDMNQKLRDDKDAMEAAHESMLMSKKTKVSRQGSQMSKYVSRPRNSSSSPSWGKQGPVQSTEDQDGQHRDEVFSDQLLLHGSMGGEAEFEGDVELGRIAKERPEDSRPVWAKNILAVVKTKAEENVQVINEEEEGEEFRERKKKLLSREVIEEVTSLSSEYSASSEHDEHEESEDSEFSDRPTSPRAAPVGTEDEYRHGTPDHYSSVGQSSALSMTTSVEMSKPERVFKVVFVGDSGVGKSSFIHRFCHDVWKSSFTATIGVDFQIKTMNVNGRCIAIQLWDTAGQERFRSITKQYFRKADGVLVLYDVTMETSFINIKDWMTSVEEGADESAVMLIGNKLDLVEDESSRLVKTEDGEKLAQNYNAFYEETSSKTGHNVREAMLRFAGALQEREDDLMQSVLNLKDVSAAQKKKCCKSS